VLRALGTRATVSATTLQALYPPRAQTMDPVKLHDNSQNHSKTPVTMAH